MAVSLSFALHDVIRAKLEEKKKKQIINSCQAIRCPTFHDETIIFIKCYQRFPFFVLFI